MKTIVGVFLAAALTACGADTNAMRVFTTNYVTAASNFREVDGQLYDINHSVKWEAVRCKYQNQAGELAVFRKIDRVKIGERRPTEGNAGLGNLSATMPEDRNIYADQDGAYILLKHLPAAHLVTGQELSPRLFRVGETNFNGAIVAIYDCGTPHVVPVVSSKLVKTP